MTERRRFEVVAPDWGEAHLTPEAVVAYVDGELAPGPRDRAVRHLGHCADCTSDVALQRQASTALRGADCPTLPSSLMSSLRAIPQSAELPCAPAGLSIGPDGEFVSVLRDETERRTSRRSRRMRIGAGAAFSGLAIGAFAFGVSGSAATPAPGTPGLDPGGAVARFAATPVPDRPAPPPSRPTILNANLPPQGR